MIRLVAAMLLAPVLAHAQTKPTISQTGRSPTGAPVASLDDVATAISTKLDRGYPVGPTTPTTSQAATKMGNTTVNLNTSNLLAPGLTAFDQLQVVTQLDPGMNVTQSSAVAGYILNNKPFDSTTNNGAGVALWGRAISAVDGAKSWGMALLVDDVYNAQGPLGRLIQNEIDMGANHTNTQVVGMAMSAGFSVQPTNADGYIIGSFNATNKWVNGFRTYDGSAKTAFLVGSTAPVGTSNVQSQPIALRSGDNTGAQRDARLFSFAGVQLALDGDLPTTFRVMPGNLGVTLEPTARTGSSLRSQRITMNSVDSGGTQRAAVIEGSEVGELLLNGIPAPLSRTISVSTTTCIPGALTSDTSYIYACVAPNTWKRAALTGF